MYRNATDFCVLILYSATSLSSFISSNSFLREPLLFSIYNIMSFADTDSFISSFTIWMPFIYFSWLIALARTSCTLLNKSGKTGHPCLVRDLR